MSIKKVVVKWGKVSLNVEVDVTKNGDAFRAMLASLTHVPQENIQLVIKGKKIENDTVLQGLNIADKSLFLMIGNVESTIIKPPTTQVKFLEELTDAEKKKEQLEIVTAGLKNVGNTCYFNSCIQTLRGIPEINGALELFSSSGRHIGPQSFAGPLLKLFKNLNTSLQSVTPNEVLNLLWKLHPEFAEKSSEGFLLQHDAEECINFLLQDLKDIPPLPISQDDVGPTAWPPSNLISQLFEGKYEIRMKNLEFPNSPELLDTENFLKLTCVIQTGLAYVQDGISLSLKSQVEKYEARSLVPPPPDEKLFGAGVSSAASSASSSAPAPASTASSASAPPSSSSAPGSAEPTPAPSLAAGALAAVTASSAAAAPAKVTVNRNCLFSCEKRFAILPPYVIVHLNRFYWKTKEEMVLGEGAGRVKIMRKVEFPLVLDLYANCTDQLKERLQPRRDELKKIKNALADARKKALEKKLDAEPGPGDKEKEKEKGKKEKEKDEDAGKEKGMEKEAEGISSSSSSSSASASSSSSPSSSPAIDLSAVTAAASAEEEPRLVTDRRTAPLNHRTAMYELFAVITHQGRSADGGHYLGWVKFGKNYWNEYDDQFCTRRYDSDILKLCGGNDWHMAYMLFYREIDRVVE